MTPRLNRNDLAVLVAMSLGLTLYHLLTSAFSAYGYFIDEFYYIACAKHLAAGYVDHPPLSPLLLAATRSLLGDSLPALRVLPALASGGLVFMTGYVAAQFGGGRGAIVLAALAASVMPVYLLMGSFYSMNAFEPLIWMLLVSLVITTIREDRSKLWVAVGVTAGLGLEMKHTVALYLVALLIGIAATTARRSLWSRWCLWGLAACAVLVLPNVAWQMANGFPSLAFYREAALNKNIATSPLAVVTTQILFANPLALPLWLAGLAWLLFAGAGRPHRFLAIAYLALLSAMMAAGASRPDRIGAIYAPLFAAGAVATASIASVPLRRLSLALAVVLLVAGGVVFVPVFTPLYPPVVLKPYLRFIGLSFDIEPQKRSEPVPQWLADRLGWEELAADVSAVYRSLPPQERLRTVIVSTNYGEAGALELFGPRYGLPPVFATHNSYHSWGPPPESAQTYICVFVEPDDLRRVFNRVEEARIHTCGDCTRPQRRIVIYVAREPRMSISRSWPRFKNYG